MAFGYALNYKKSYKKSCKKPISRIEWITRFKRTSQSKNESSKLYISLLSRQPCTVDNIWLINFIQQKSIKKNFAHKVLTYWSKPRSRKYTIDSLGNPHLVALKDHSKLMSLRDVCYLPRTPQECRYQHWYRLQTAARKKGGQVNRSQVQIVGIINLVIYRYLTNRYSKRTKWHVQRFSLINIHVEIHDIIE
jgi:hypothetical protein